jgi:RNA polymerase sigma-70 factor (ECF subfamily)
VARAKQGDHAAIRFLYLRYADNIYGYARSIVRNDQDAEDIVQQVFTRMMTAIQNYEQRSAPFSAWLLRVTENLAIDYVRRRARVCEEPEEGASLDEPEHDGRHLRLILGEAFAQLPPAQREIVVLRHVAGLSPKEIAERLGRSEDSIHGLHHRGRLALREALTQMGATPSTGGLSGRSGEERPVVRGTSRRNRDPQRVGLLGKRRLVWSSSTCGM